MGEEGRVLLPRTEGLVLADTWEGSEDDSFFLAVSHRR